MKSGIHLQKKRCKLLTKDGAKLSYTLVQARFGGVSTKKKESAFNSSVSRESKTKAAFGVNNNHTNK